MQGRFARVPVWASHGYTQRQHQGERAREWLLIEWPKEPLHPQFVACCFDRTGR